jgi:hypothetical protein
VPFGPQFILEGFGPSEGASFPPGSIPVVDGVTEISPADILANWLIAEGYGTNPSAGLLWPTYVNFMPGGRNEALCVYDTVGTQDGRDMRTGRLAEHPGVSIRVRALDHRSGWVKVSSLANVLDGLNNAVVTFGGSTYSVQNAKRTGNSNSLGEDPANRTRLFTVNALLTVTEITP